MIYAVVDDRRRFREQLLSEQNNDPVIRSATECVVNGVHINEGRLKRVQSQLRVEDGILTKSGRPVVPASLRKFVTSHIHDTGHWGPEKTYALLKERFYWPNMYNYTVNFVSYCETCQQTKCDTHPPKAPLIPMVIPEAPMQFVSIDIAYMPTDKDGYKYILLAGDIFSKYIHAIPLRDQTAPSIVRAFEKDWIFTHGSPLYLLSDQGSNVDGDTVREFCNRLGIEKRRSSPYHSQGNGFAERNIRSVREILRSALLSRKMSEDKWRKLLPGLVFALNCSVSKATKAVPYSVVFGRKPTLPIDVLFGTTVTNRDAVSPEDNSDEVGISLEQIWDSVKTHLEISKRDMVTRYNRNIRFHDYLPGERVWLKADVINAGENKLAPKRSGPWTIVEKMPNGVTFRISNNDTGVTKVVHHDKLKLVRSSPSMADSSPREPGLECHRESEGSTSSASSSVHSDYSPSESDDSDSSVEEPVANRRYPVRNRPARVLPGAIPWDAVPDGTLSLCVEGRDVGLWNVWHL